MIHRVAVVALVATATWAAAVAPATTHQPSDRALARAGVLVRSDLPAGWTSRARHTASDDERDAAAAVRACKPFVTFSRANDANPHARSRDFQLGSAEITNAVSVYPSTARAEARMRTIVDPRVPTCLERLFTARVRAARRTPRTSGARVTSVRADVQPVAGIRIGDEAIGYQGALAVGLEDGTTRTVSLGFVVVRVGPALAGYTYTTETDIAAALQPAIVASVARLQHARSGT